MTHVEMIGLSGAGKTTLAEELYESSSVVSPSQVAPDPVAGSDRDLRSRIRHRLRYLSWITYRRRRYFSAYTDAYPDSAEVIAELSAVAEEPVPTLPGLFEDSAAEYMALKERYADNAILFDEGLWQFGALALKLTEALGGEYLRTLPIPDVVIAIECPAKVCLKRQRSRNKGLETRLEAVDEEAALSDLSDMNDRFNQVAAFAERNGARVYTVDTHENTLAEATEDCEEILCETPQP